MFVCFLSFAHILVPLSLFLSFSLHTVACCHLIRAFLTSPQDVFREARSHDQMDAKNDMETHVRPRKLPLTRKIYAFYHAPIVKFWSNTVWRLQKRTQAHTHACIHTLIYNHLLHGGLSGRELWVAGATKRGRCYSGAATLQRYRCVVKVIIHRAFTR